MTLDPAGSLYVADTSPAFDNAQALVEKVVNLAPPSTPATGDPSLSGKGVDFPWSPIPGVTSYVVTVYVNGVAQPPIGDVTGSSYTLTNPVPGATYSFTIAATGSGGTGGASALSSSVSVPVPPASSGYWTVAGDGGAFSFGLGFYGSAANLELNQPVSAITSTSDGKGYWSVAKDGGVYAYGAPFHGSAAGSALTRPVVGLSATRDGSGYYLVAADGGVVSFNAPLLGSMGGRNLHAPMVAIAVAG